MGAVPSYEDSRTIGGWMTRTDHLCFIAADALQAGTTGDLLEIGAFEGRSAVVIGGLARPDEVVHVCDPFDAEVGDDRTRAENSEWYPNLQRSTFDANYARFHDVAPIVHQCLSSDVELPPARFRFVHIDGGHLFETVASDIALSRVVGTPDSIVILDDYRMTHVPGVAAATWQAVGEGLTPLILTNGKMYATWAPERYPVEAVEQALEEVGCTTRRSQFLDRPAVVATALAPPRARWVRSVLRRSRRLRSLVVDG